MAPKVLRRLLVVVALKFRLSLLLLSQQPEEAVVLQVLQVVEVVEQGAWQCLRCLELRMEQ
jgi:hypothetical protein